MGKRVAILSFSEAVYTTRRLLEAGRELGFDMVRIDPLAVYLHLGDPRGEGAGVLLGADGRPLPIPDYVIPRIGATLSDWAYSLFEALLARGARAPVKPAALALAADKLRTTQALAAAGLPVVDTVAVRELAHARPAIDAVGGPPVVLKLRRGNQGKGVLTASDLESAVSTLDALITLGHTVLVQPRVEMSHPRDLRVLIAGGEPLACCWRHAAEGEFRSNLHRGGQASIAHLSMEAAQLSISAAKAVGLAFCGVDLLPAPDGLKILEVNGSPGLEGLEQATGRDLARSMIEAMRR